MTLGRYARRSAEYTIEKLKEALSLQSNTSVVHTGGHVSDIGRHDYFQERFDGLPVFNAVANVVSESDGRVVAYGSAFIEPAQREPKQSQRSYDTLMNTT